MSSCLPSNSLLYLAWWLQPTWIKQPNFWFHHFILTQNKKGLELHDSTVHLRLMNGPKKEFCLQNNPVSLENCIMIVPRNKPIPTSHGFLPSLRTLFPARPAHSGASEASKKIGENFTGVSEGPVLGQKTPLFCGQNMLKHHLGIGTC